MTLLTVGQENDQDIQIHFEDHGTGRPQVLIHGYPLDGRSWDKPEHALLEAGSTSSRAEATRAETRSI